MKTFEYKKDQGYALVVWLDPIEAGFIFIKANWPTEPSTILAEFKGKYPDGLSGLQSIDLTRDLEGDFNIFVNGSHIMKTTDTTWTTSNYFGFDTPGGHALDIITTDDEIIVTQESASGFILISAVFTFMMINLVRRRWDK
jgi:hypothetical protein